MIITKLEYQKNNPNRVNVYVDEKFAVGISTDDVIKLGINRGQEITQEELNKIIAQSDFGKALGFAINFLSFRPRSEWEVRQSLKRKGFENIDEIIFKLKQIGLVDDEKFAAWWQEQRSTFRPKGERALNMELARKGVKVKVKVENELELALKAIKKKLPMEKDKIFRYLATRGFDFDTINEVIAKVKDID
jgi:regulatory protein